MKNVFDKMLINQPSSRRRDLVGEARRGRWWASVGSGNRREIWNSGRRWQRSSAEVPPSNWLPLKNLS